jgi:hypothetical protein
LNPGHNSVDLPEMRGALLAVLAFIVFMANGRVYEGETDAISSRTLPFAILGSGSIYLDPVRDVAVDPYRPDRRWWAARTRTGAWGSLFPLVTPIIVTPLYIPAVAYLAARGWTTERLLGLSLIMERVAASAVSALAVLFLYLALLRRGVATHDALLLAAALAFATGTWSISSQQLWLHAAAELLVAASLWAMAGAPRAGAALFCGSCIALLACNRPSDAVLAAGLGCAALVWAPASRWRLIGPAAIFGGVTLGYNLYVFAHPLGAWGYATAPTSFLWQGIAGQLVSPTRGLLVFSPFLVFVPLGIWRSLRERKHALATAALTAGVVGHILVYAGLDWRAGWSYGPRYILDAVPVLIWLMAPALAHLRLLGRGILLALIAFAMWVQYVGAFHYNSNSDRLIFKENDGHAEFRHAWDWANTPFLVEFRNERQPAGLLKQLDRL